MINQQIVNVVNEQLALAFSGGRYQAMPEEFMEIIKNKVLSYTGNVLERNTPLWNHIANKLTMYYQAGEKTFITASDEPKVWDRFEEASAPRTDVAGKLNAISAKLDKIIQKLGA